MRIKKELENKTYINVRMKESVAPRSHSIKDEPHRTLREGLEALCLPDEVELEILDALRLRDNLKKLLEEAFDVGFHEGSDACREELDCSYYEDIIMFTENKQWNEVYRIAKEL